MFTLLEYTMSVHFVGDDSQLNAIKSLQFSQKCKAPMKTPRRYAPMGGSFAPVRVAVFRWNGVSPALLTPPENYSAPPPDSQ